MNDWLARFLVGVALLPNIDFVLIYYNKKYWIYKDKFDKKPLNIIIPAWIIFIVVMSGFLSSFIHQNNQDAFLFGASVGLVSYISFNMTNLAIFKKWDVQAATFDTLWGCLLAGTVSLIMHNVASGETDHTRVDLF